MDEPDVHVPDLPLLCLTTNAGTGKELSDLLRARLGIPDSARWFEVRFAVGEPICVTVEYLPRE